MEEPGLEERMLLDWAPLCVFDYRAGGRLERVWLSPGARLLLGCEGPMPAAVEPEDMERLVEELDAALAAGREARAELRARAGEGSWKWFSLGAAPVCRQGDGCRFRGLLTDIDALKTRELDTELRAREAALAKSEFISRMGHDMRTPLNAILSLSGGELLEGVCEERKDEYLSKIHSSGQYLLGILNDVLDMARIEGGKLSLSPEPYTLEEFAASINAVIGQQCREKGVEFVFASGADVSRPLMLDKLRFNQVFMNLLANAVKFTPAGGRIELLARRLPGEEGTARLRFTVRDSGIGMSPEFLPRAFDSFAQENRRGVRWDDLGTGLGLSIVKKLVEMMGGSVSVESVVDEGTVFTVELSAPLAPAEETPDAAGREPRSLRGARVLLCEDHPLNARITVGLLEKQGCCVDCAGNGGEGVARFVSSPPGCYDVILMDIRMPVMDGLQAARAIRALPRPDASRVPIIALTADASAEGEEVSLRAGMNAHLTKPIEPVRLFETMEECMDCRGGV